MKISVITVGKIKEKYFVDSIKEYSKRLGRYCKLEIIEVADEKTPDQCSDGEERIIKEKEADRIEKYIKKDTYLIILDVLGESITSPQLSNKIQQLGVEGKSHLTFVIGGSLGIDPNLLKKADYRLSFSKMTFPHQLMRVILLEQIYRSFRIMQNEPYHK